MYIYNHSILYFMVVHVELGIFSQHSRGLFGWKKICFFITVIVIPSHRWKSKALLIWWWFTFPSMTGDDYIYITIYIYSLVMTNIAIENCHSEWVYLLKMVDLSIVFSRLTRGYIISISSRPCSSQNGPYSYGPLPVISTYNPIYRMYNPIYNQL